MNFYASRGFPKSKLNAVLPFYGQSFKLASSDNNYGAKIVGPGELLLLIKPLYAKPE